MGNLSLDRRILAAAIMLTLTGCSTTPGIATKVMLPPASALEPAGAESRDVSKSPGWTDTQVMASARYVWIRDQWTELKSQFRVLADEDKLRSGSISLSQDNANALLAELSRAMNQEVQSTVTANLALGHPGRFGIGNTDDVRGRMEVVPMINGEIIMPKPEVLVELQLFPLEIKDGTLHLEVELAVTTLERFIGYKTEADAGLEAGSRLKLVELPSGFYKPVFAIESTKADVQIVSGEVVLILSSSGDRLYFLTASAKPVMRTTKR